MSLNSLKSIFFVFSFLVMPMSFAQNYGVYEDHPYEFSINKIVSKYSEKYAINQLPEGSQTYPTTYPGVIKKSAFRIRTHYDLSDQNGWQATGITRVLSLGSIYSWATDIDIYDTRGIRFGLIHGSIATIESAKFSIYSYDEKNNATVVGVALANADFTHFSISTPGNYLPICDLVRNTKNDSWTVSVVTPEIIDDRIIRIFAGFLVNHQHKFLTP